MRVKKIHVGNKVTLDKEICIIFKVSALWADAFYKSKCSSVFPSVRLSVCVSVHF